MTLPTLSGQGADTLLGTGTAMNVHARVGGQQQACQRALGHPCGIPLLTGACMPATMAVSGHL